MSSGGALEVMDPHAWDPERVGFEHAADGHAAVDAGDAAYVAGGHEEEDGFVVFGGAAHEGVDELGYVVAGKMCSAEVPVPTVIPGVACRRRCSGPDTRPAATSSPPHVFEAAVAVARGPTRVWCSTQLPIVLPVGFVCGRSRAAASPPTMSKKETRRRRPAVTAPSAVKSGNVQRRAARRKSSSCSGAPACCTAVMRARTSLSLKPMWRRAVNAFWATSMAAG